VEAWCDINKFVGIKIVTTVAFQMHSSLGARTPTYRTAKKVFHKFCWRQQESHSNGEARNFLSARSLFWYSLYWTLRKQKSFWPKSKTMHAQTCHNTYRQAALSKQKLSLILLKLQISLLSLILTLFWTSLISDNWRMTQFLFRFLSTKISTCYRFLV